ncbi:hypothetical protein TNCV_5036691 [Trichonephila clavipes]|nr:hypothetical protein TNCV_5036691 [Trichonephila clavipes]
MILLRLNRERQGPVGISLRRPLIVGLELIDPSFKMSLLLHTSSREERLSKDANQDGTSFSEPRVDIIGDYIG